MILGYFRDKVGLRAEALFNSENTPGRKMNLAEGDVRVEKPSSAELEFSKTCVTKFARICKPGVALEKTNIQGSTFFANESFAKNEQNDPHAAALASLLDLTFRSTDKPAIDAITTQSDAERALWLERVHDEDRIHKEASALTTEIDLNTDLHQRSLNAVTRKEQSERPEPHDNLLHPPQNYAEKIETLKAEQHAMNKRHTEERDASLLSVRERITALRAAAAIHREIAQPILAKYKNSEDISVRCKGITSRASGETVQYLELYFQSNQNPFALFRMSSELVRHKQGYGGEAALDPEHPTQDNVQQGVRVVYERPNSAKQTETKLVEFLVGASGVVLRREEVRAANT